MSLNPQIYGFECPAGFYLLTVNNRNTGIGVTSGVKYVQS